MANMESSNALWNAILKWSIAQMQQDDGTKPSELRPLSDEDRHFLSEAMASMAVDEIGRMKQIIGILRLPTDAALLSQVADQALELLDGSTGSAESVDVELISRVREKKLDALDELDHIVLTIDRAVDFDTLGGLQPLLSHLELPAVAQEPEIASAALHVLGTLTANNDQTQQKVQQHNGVALLLAALSLTIGQLPQVGLRYPRAHVPEAHSAAGKAEVPSDDHQQLRRLQQEHLEHIPEASRLSLVSKLLLALGCTVRNSKSGHQLVLQPGGRGLALVLDVLVWASRHLQTHEDAAALLAAADGDVQMAVPAALRQSRNVIQKCLRLLQYFCDCELVPEFDGVAVIVVHRSAFSALLRVADCVRDRPLRECLWETLLVVARAFCKPILVSPAASENDGDVAAEDSEVISPVDFFLRRNDGQLRELMLRYRQRALEELGEAAGGYDAAAASSSNNNKKKKKWKPKKKKNVQGAAQQQPAAQIAPAGSEPDSADNPEQLDMVRSELHHIEQLARELRLQLS